jgi:hypothetical protein
MQAVACATDANNIAIIPMVAATAANFTFESFIIRPQ